MAYLNKVKRIDLMELCEWFDVPITEDATSKAMMEAIREDPAYNEENVKARLDFVIAERKENEKIIAEKEKADKEERKEREKAEKEEKKEREKAEKEEKKEREKAEKEERKERENAQRQHELEVQKAQWEREMKELRDKIEKEKIEEEERKKQAQKDFDERMAKMSKYELHKLELLSKQYIVQELSETVETMKPLTVQENMSKSRLEEIEIKKKEAEEKVADNARVDSERRQTARLKVYPVDERLATRPITEERSRAREIICFACEEPGHVERFCNKRWRKQNEERKEVRTYKFSDYAERRMQEWRESKEAGAKKSIHDTKTPIEGHSALRDYEVEGSATIRNLGNDGKMLKIPDEENVRKMRRPVEKRQREEKPVLRARENKQEKEKSVEIVSMEICDEKVNLEPMKKERKKRCLKSSNSCSRKPKRGYDRFRPKNDTYGKATSGGEVRSGKMNMCGDYAENRCRSRYCKRSIRGRKWDRRNVNSEQYGASQGVRRRAKSELRKYRDMLLRMEIAKRDRECDASNLMNHGDPVSTSSTTKFVKYWPERGKTSSYVTNWRMK